MLIDNIKFFFFFFERRTELQIFILSKSQITVSRNTTILHTKSEKTDLSAVYNYTNITRTGN
jgi:hypothetical protein